MQNTYNNNNSVIIIKTRFSIKKYDFYCRKGSHMIIESKTVIRKCSSCTKEYSDTQIIINGFPCLKVAICPNCLKTLWKSSPDESNFHGNIYE